VVLNENFVENKTLSHLGKQKDILERERECVCVWLFNTTPLVSQTQ